jgi:hypothetical protein
VLITGSPDSLITVFLKTLKTSVINYFAAQIYLKELSYNDAITNDCMPIYQDGECWDPVNRSNPAYHVGDSISCLPKVLDHLESLNSEC